MPCIKKSSNSLSPEQLMVLIKGKEKQSEKTKVISLKSYGKSGPEQN